MAEIGAGQVGIVFALEASRLARSNADWHRLVEICVVTNTLLADERTVYDPRDPNDRLLLGVKGTISEAELFTLKQRFHEGRWNKAKRGELVRSLPVGYVRQENGEVVKDPSQQVQARVRHIFELFGRFRVARKVVVQLVEEKLRIPATENGVERITARSSGKHQNSARSFACCTIPRMPERTSMGNRSMIRLTVRQPMVRLEFIRAR
jgi:DNA invertase Pin-like site-specific DNA recombinase